MTDSLQSIERVAQIWAAWMWPMAWQIALIAMAVLVVALLVRRISPRFRYLLWCLVLLKLCLPPTLSFVTGVGQWVLPEAASTAPIVATAPELVVAEPPATRIDAPHPPVAPIAEMPHEHPGDMRPPAVLVTEPVVVTSTPAPAPEPVESEYRLSWLAALFVVWIGGVVMLLGLFAFQHRRVSRMLAKGRPVEDPRILDLLAEARKALNVRGHVRLLSVEDLPSPILFGVMRPCIAIPAASLATLPLEHVRPILLHELAHHRRRDLWLGFGQMLLQVLYWFHPAVWLANARLRRERELIVDDVVLSHLRCKRETYGASLLGILRQGAQRHFLTPGYVGIVETPGNIAHRLKRILDARHKISVRLGWAALVALVVLALVLIPQARSQDRETKDPELKPAEADATPATEALKPEPATENAKPPVRETIRVAGKVTSPDGRPVEGAKLVLYHMKSRWGLDNAVVQETVSLKNGAFAFKDPVQFDQVIPHAYAKDKYIVIAVHPGFAFAWANVEQEGFQESYEIKLTVPQTKTVTVTDMEGKPLQGARVRLFSAGDREADEPEFRSYLRLPTEIEALTVATDAQGRATFGNLPDTRCAFKAALPGYASNFGVETDLIRLIPGANVTGRVETADGKPVGEATVWLSSDYGYNFYLWARVNADGRFEFKDVPPKGWGGRKEVTGSYKLSLRSDRYIVPEQTIVLDPGQTMRDLTLKATPGAKVRVLALDPETKQPVAGARITARATGGRLNGFTGADGVVEWTVAPGKASFGFNSPPDGMYVVDDPYKGRLPNPAVVVGTEPLSVTVYASGRIDKLISMRGRVQLPDDTPAQGVRLVQCAKERYGTATYVGGSGTSVVTDADGAFKYEGMPGGLTVLLYGETKDREFVLAKEVPLPVESGEFAQPLVMQRGQVAEIELKDGRGLPRANMSLTLSPSKWEIPLQRWFARGVATDGQGRLRVNGIVPGMEYFIIDAKADRSRSDWQAKFFYTTVQLLPADHAAGATTPVTLVASREADKAFIKVVDTRGQTVRVREIRGLVILMKDKTPWYPGIAISILERRDDGTLVTDRKGFSLGGPDAKLKIEVVTDAGAKMTATAIRPKDGSNRLLFTTTGATPTLEFADANVAPEDASVMVLDPKGRPVPDAKVMLVRSPIPERNVSATTDDQGSAIFKDVEKLRYRYVEVEAAGYALQWPPRLHPGKALVLRMDNSTRAAGKFVLPNGKPAGTGEIRLVCKKYADADGMDVDCSPAPLLRQCDEQGQYDFLLTPGLYDIEVLCKSGYFGKWSDVRVERGKVIVLPEKLDPAARLELRVVDSATDKPVPGIEFYIWDRSGGVAITMRAGSARTTDANGIAIWEALVPGRVEVDFGRDQYARCWSDKSLIKIPGEKSASGKPPLRGGTTQLVFDLTRGMAPITVVVERAVTAMGHVFDADGKPVEGAQVNVHRTGAAYSLTGDSRYMRRTDANGAYTISFPAGNGIAYVISAHDPQNRWADAWSKSFESSAGDAFTFDFALEEGGQITGRVVDAEGKGVGNVYVGAAPPDAIAHKGYYLKATTDRDGSFAIKAVGDGDYRVYPLSSNWVGSHSAGTEINVKVRDKATVSVGDLTWTAEP